MDLANRGAALALHRGGSTQVSIAEQLQIPRSTIQSFLSKLHKDPISDETLADRPRAGRPRATTEKQDRLLHRTILKDASMQTDDLAQHISGGGSMMVSDRTIRRRAAEWGLYHRVQRKTPALTRSHVQKRLDCANAHIDWSFDDWSRVLFSDESSVQCGSNHGQQWIWRRIDEAWADGKTQPTIKVATTMKFWCSMSAAGPGSLHIIEESLTSDSYFKILQQHLIADGTRLCGSDFLFQQDNHPSHKTERIQRFLEEKGIQELQWPPNSPDFSPIENMFSVLKRLVAERCPPSKDDLIRITLEEWENLGSDYTYALVSSFPDRMQAAMTAGGGATKY
ncbi:putative Transposable element Tc1 transposase [Blattamonas nauphoetae]|uniref:Transposable element Tc1 transposase n=1 Tax=Blattamonas nauphoetae TaxID=2049346 RepID=A0ABQ9X090_9EUKA|nr:putative Transposable element Tc1 transposase [Blattamonas nauphoetae]